MKFIFVSHGISSTARKKIIDFVGPNPKLLLITTPAKTYSPTPSWLTDSIEELRQIGFTVDLYDIEQAFLDKDDIATKIKNYGVVGVSGGNVFYFLHWAYQVGLKEILQNFLNNGGIFLGESAGAVCQIHDLEPLKLADKPELAPTVVKHGLELTDIIIVPHWNNPKYQSVLEKIRELYLQQNLTVYPLSDGQVMIVDGNKREII